MTKENILSRAANANYLVTRIAENVTAQQVDLNEWIFTHLSVGPEARVLELCCGTGQQTVQLLERVGSRGQIVAMDVSRQALQSLEAKLSPEMRTRLKLLEASMDELGGEQVATPSFDLVFCAYGLYYSADARRVLSEGKGLLKPSGSLVVVGPYGPNNALLFRFLEQQKVRIPDYVRYTSQDFMWQEVVPWATLNFTSVRINTLVNPVRWQSAQSVLSYWQNSTFFDEQRQADVQAGLADYFCDHTEFVNEKSVMMLVANNG